MADKIIYLADARNGALAIPDRLESPSGNVADRLGRPLHDLRISITDRCNFRCVYCMPKDVFDKNHVYLPHTDLLSFEEITRVARLFVAHGVEKIRLTGGEPLLRKNIEKLIAMLAALRTPSGQPLDLTLTTNGSLLARKAQALKEAGLNRVTVSLDSLDDATFKRMNDVDFSVADVLHGIDAAHAAGLGPIKINMVVKAGMNEQEIVPMARHFKDTPYILRFIEYMDVGASNGWNLQEVIPRPTSCGASPPTCPCCPSTRTMWARRRRAGATRMARAKSASFPASRKRSAATAAVPAYRRKASCTPVCSPPAATTCAACCAAAIATWKFQPWWRSCGAAAATAIRHCVPARRT